MRIGVVGTGHLGKIHLNCLKQTPFKTAGVFDIDSEKAHLVASDHDVKCYSSIDLLIEDVDAVIIVSDTSSHFDVAKIAINAGVHAFIEKPVTATLDQAKLLAEMANQSKGLVLQVGHVERYNPAFTSALPKIKNPGFIECHRLANFNPRGNDVSVVFDLMIHDLDILLACVDSKVIDVKANGVQVISETSDIVNARIEFESGCVANVTASRLSLNPMRKFRIFQNDAYLSIDFLKKANQLVSLSDKGDESLVLETKNGKKYLNIEINESENVNAIVNEQLDFHDAIANKKPVSVDVHHALKVMELADQIEKIVLSR